ncbi:MAG: peptidoglycan -binding protein [Alphaproteobacteria bacterium]|nr:peptidoglycan -binding protein [Alphaproteobacteria bacterium]
MAVARTTRVTQNYWPGFVDVLAAVLMVVVFLVMVFALAQFSFSELLARSEGEVSTLEGRLTAMRDEAERGRSRILELDAILGLARGQLADSEAEAGAQRGRVEGLALRLTESEDRVARAVEELSAGEAHILELLAALTVLEQSVETRDQSLAEAGGRTIELEDQMATLSKDINAIAAALQASETRTGAQAIEIEDLGAKLTQALASQVADLEGYRSEFFGRLRDLIGDQAGIEIVGDRFVLQSEILFASGEAVLRAGGRLELMRLASTLRAISADIPPDIDWIIRVGGHTDVRPIATEEYPSNWDLSAARALEVVRFLTAEGIPANRLMAAGFGEFQPIDFGATEEALARNRRIEFKLTER